jgi:hypothetical protein
LLALSVADAVQAAVITIEGTVKSVDAKKRTITVQTKTKTLELDVSRKAKVSVKGKTAKLDSLKPGQKVTISYHEGLEIVLKIEAQGKGLPAPELVILRELDAPRWEGNPCVSPDGLRIYWNIKSPTDNVRWVWTAKRKDPDSLFEAKKRLIPAVDFTVTSDGLEMILLQKSGVLGSATRDDVDGAFRRTKTINEFGKKFGFLAAPCISSDSLTLYYGRLSKGKGIQFHVSTRRTRTSKWSSPKPLQLTPSGHNLRFLTVSPEDNLLFCNAMDIEGETQPNLIMYSRKNSQESFHSPGFVDCEGITVRGSKNGAFARYVPATHELFFAGMTEKGGESKLMILKSFSPDTMVKSILKK